MFSKSISRMAITFLLLIPLSGCMSAEKVKPGAQPTVAVKEDPELQKFLIMNPNDLDRLGSEAAVYGYPLVLMDASREAAIQSAKGSGGRGGINRFYHKRTTDSAQFHQDLNPNLDMLSSTAWVDLSREPLVFSIPNTGNRYRILSLLDAWSNVFSSLGTRTTGNRAGTYFLFGPDYKGAFPPRLKKLKAPTNLIRIEVAIRSSGKKDSQAVVALQNRFKLTPYSQWEPSFKPAMSNQAAKNIKLPYDLEKAPTDQVSSLHPENFLTRLSELMLKIPASSEDKAMLEKLALIGVHPGRTVNYAQLPTKVRETLGDGVRRGFGRVAELAGTVGTPTNGWIYSTEDGDYGVDYEYRARLAASGLGANLGLDLVSPEASLDEEGDRLNGTDNKYVLHFAKGQRPPVNGFWSLTLYGPDHFLAVNRWNRYVIYSGDALKINRDGSLDIYIQANSPGKAKVSNWLPAPRGEFHLTLRLYGPKKNVLSGEWEVPPVRKLTAAEMRLTQLSDEL